MNWKDLLDSQHANVHSASVGGDTPFSYQELVLGGLREDQLRLRPADDQNSLAWLLWHMTRCEDVAINVAITGGRQVLSDGWTAKMGVDREDIGTGMTPPEVAALSERIDISALLSYRDAVGGRTREIINAVSDADIETRVDAERYRLARVLGEHAGWLDAGWSQWRGRDFLFLATGHCYQHWGEAITVRAIAGFPVGH
jgi:hypothetical protein